VQACRPRQIDKIDPLESRNRPFCPETTSFGLIWFPQNPQPIGQLAVSANSTKSAGFVVAAGTMSLELSLFDGILRPAM
jgi:hypothetical protein